MSNGVKAWSYSAAAAYIQCPYKFANERGHGGHQKQKGEQSPAMARGDRIHKLGEKYVLAHDPAAPPPVEFKLFEKQMRELAAMPKEDTVVEQQWGFDINWKATGYFGPTTWFRSKLDAAVVYEDGTADVVDYKTGKIYPENADQRELNAVAFFRRFPHVETLNSAMWYLDSDDKKPERLETFFAEDVPALIHKWEARVAPMFTDEVFAPRPNDKCQWCHLAKSKGGKCRFG